MELAIVDQGDISAAQDTSAKRKRGRPKRDPETPRVQNVRVPRSPGITVVKGNRPRQTTAAAENPSDEMVGQLVSGVVEATFDAGYLLNVRVGNSDITLRGVVFKPGRYVPISPQNDLAPNAPMIRRQEVPLPRRNKIQVQRNKYRPGEKIENNGTVDSSIESTLAKRVSPVSNKVASPSGSRATFVPVLLQSVNLSNGINTTAPDGINTATPAPHLLASKFNQPPVLAIQAPPLSNQVVHDHNQSNQQEASTGAQDEGNHHSDQPMTEFTNNVEAKPGRSADNSFQTLLGEVMKRKTGPHSGDVPSGNISASGNTLGENIAFTQDIRDSDMSEPLLIKPLQAFQPDLHEQSVPIGGLTGNEKVGKMTELLQDVQENKKDNKQLQHQPQDHNMQTNSSHEMRSSGSEDTHEEVIHSNPHSQASSF